MLVEFYAVSVFHFIIYISKLHLPFEKVSMTATNIITFAHTKRNEDIKER